MIHDTDVQAGLASSIAKYNQGVCKPLCIMYHYVYHYVYVLCNLLQSVC